VAASRGREVTSANCPLLPVASALACGYSLKPEVILAAASALIHSRQSSSIRRSGLVNAGGTNKSLRRTLRCTAISHKRGRRIPIRYCQVQCLLRSHRPTYARGSPPVARHSRRERSIRPVPRNPAFEQSDSYRKSGSALLAAQITTTKQVLSIFVSYRHFAFEGKAKRLEAA
jgi:hypothetical protein